MGSHSPHPNSLSPQIKQTSTAFHWPIPESPSRLKPIKPQNKNMNELSIKEILERYNEDPELMKYILTAKSEEDKKKAAKDTLKVEEARIQLRQMDLDFAREQTKASARYERHSLHPAHHYAPSPQHPQQSYGPYYGLAPVQQQVLARFNYPPQYGGQPPPSSPSVPYPHSAHPLCTSTNTNTNNTNTDPNDETNYKKRNRSSITSPNEQANDVPPQDKLLHNKVMEALKAKIQRGNGGPPSPLAPPPTSSIPQENQIKKRKTTLPRPVVVHSTTTSSPSPSPRSAKPVLPPIDTNLGRIDSIKLEASNDSSSSMSSSNSNSSIGDSGGSDSNKMTQQEQETTTTMKTTTAAVASPSDHILLNTRRARSLSPCASSLSKKT
ncbi:hypothetical protein EDC94DRAFT_522837 [Helicostylum pulchrum]|nr:hypothetical protein EDC94DRAFT_522837 [Helicostylum pulchrum]